MELPKYFIRMKNRNSRSIPINGTFYFKEWHTFFILIQVRIATQNMQHNYDLDLDSIQEYLRCCTFEKSLKKFNQIDSCENWSQRTWLWYRWDKSLLSDDSNKKLKMPFSLWYTMFWRKFHSNLYKSLSLNMKCLIVFVAKR